MKRVYFTSEEQIQEGGLGKLCRVFFFGFEKVERILIMAAKEKSTEAIYDAKTLGTSKMFVLGLQHLFAMFGATVLVPAITGLNVSTTLLFAGLGTLLFHLITGRKVPAFLGSSFAFLGAYGLVTASGQNIPLTYSGIGVAVAGLVYLVLALFFKIFGAQKVMRFFKNTGVGCHVLLQGIFPNQGSNPGLPH